MTQNSITFLLNDETKTLRDYAPSMTVLDYLRRIEGKTGTKEGCASGDCGACTVVLRAPNGHYKTINACISLLPALNGHQLITVEDLKDGDQLHGTQQAFIDNDGSQCGFCTPGFIMSSFALHKNHKDPSRTDVLEALAGNLCRCTGYRSIVDAALETPVKDQFDRNDENTLKKLASLQQATAVFGDEQSRCFMPANLDELAQLLEQHPSARILAGATDLGLEVTQHLKNIETLIYIGNVNELKTVEEDDQWLSMGAGVTFTEMLPTLHALYPDFGDMIERLGSQQIRNQGTMGGNIGNASPVGDTPPVLIALGARLVLRKGDQSREISIAEYFKDYKVTDLQTSEFIERIRIPKPDISKALKVYKVSKRLDDDISAVLAAFHIQIIDDKVAYIQIGFGGMAAIPKRAPHCENALIGQPWNMSTIANGMAALEQDFAPMTDARATKEYRLTVAQNLLKKCYIELTEPDTKSRVLFYDASQKESTDA
jgi:xanthine dehydrogenase small subunit